MVTEKHRVAALCRIAVSLIALGLVGPSEASPAAVDRQQASSVSSAESITPGDIVVGPDRNLGFPARPGPAPGLELPR
jgi:hypothetical protein